MAKLVPFSINKWTDDAGVLVSEDRYEEMISYRWYGVNCNGKIYAARRATKEEQNLGASSIIYMHRQILGIHLKKTGPNLHSRHLNGNTFDNTNENLAKGTVHQNGQERKNNTGVGRGLWGATFRKHPRWHKKPWAALFTIGGKPHYPTPVMHATEEEAHEAAVKLYTKMTGHPPLITLGDENE